MSLAPWKVGPFRIRPEIILSDLGYDSNIYSQPEAVGDYRLTVGPSFTGYLIIRKKIVLTLYESPRYVYFYETARERAWNNYFRGDVSILLNKAFFSAGQPGRTPGSGGTTKLTSGHGESRPTSRPQHCCRRGKRPVCLLMFRRPGSATKTWSSKAFRSLKNSTMTNSAPPVVFTGR